MANAPFATRTRRQTYERARLIFEEALDALKSHLTDFHAQNYTNAPQQDLAQTDLRPRYRRLRQREQVLLAAMEDLNPLLEKAGMAQEQTILQQEVDSAQSTSISARQHILLFWQ